MSATAKTVLQQPRSIAYEADFYGWAMRQADLVRSGQWDQLDLENIAGELEGLARSERRQMRNHLAILLMHLLKWQYQPQLHERHGRSWRLTIEEQRRQLRTVIEENPSLKPQHDKILTDAYGDALIKAERETGLERSVFPSLCPWLLDQIMDDEFWP
jgi:hypothetical protein